MKQWKQAAAAVVGTAVLCLGTLGCGTQDGKAHPADDSGADGQTAVTSTPADTAEPTTSAAPPSGAQVGTATMEIQGSGTATIRYRINGGAEQTENGATLPWSKQYPVYPELNSSVSAQGSGATGCTIMMADKIASFKMEPNPTCEFAYY